MPTADQIKIIHVAKTKLSLSRDDYEAILQEQAGVVTSKDLSKAGFEKVMRRMEELGFENLAKKKKPSREYRPKAAVTPEQQKLIAALFNELGWIETSRQMGFSKRCCRKNWPQSRTDANKVIEGLKAMIRRAPKA
jgi:hypothetical protein